MKTKIAIVGYGFVGKATEHLFRNSKIEILIHDPEIGHVIDDWREVAYAFLCVPTNEIDGRLDTSILHSAYDRIPEWVDVVIRSTIGPDQVTEFSDNTIFMPEFLRESHWKQDVDDTELPIIIGSAINVETLFDIIPVHKKIVHVQSKDAMMYKLARNSALAMTVALANEFYAICENLNIDYKILSDMLTEDPVVANSHWQVPGPDGNSGFGGKCLPKDLTHMSSLCYSHYNILHEAINMNKLRRT